MPTTNAQGYTAGPWYVTASSPDGYVYGADHSCIVPFGPESAGRMDARRWTDARLISAAPELLQALELAPQSRPAWKSSRKARRSSETSWILYCLEA